VFLAITHQHPNKPTETPYLMPPADSELQTNTFGEPVHRDEARDKLSLPATMGKRPL